MSEQNYNIELSNIETVYLDHESENDEENREFYAVSFEFSAAEHVGEATGGFNIARDEYNMRVIDAEILRDAVIFSSTRELSDEARRELIVQLHKALEVQLRDIVE